MKVKLPILVYNGMKMLVGCFSLLFFKMNKKQGLDKHKSQYM